MYIPEHRKILFIHIQRTGGTSVTNLLTRNCHPSHLIHAGHKSYYNYEQEMADLDEYFKFSFVRNPWERIVSWYKLLTKLATPENFTLEDFIDDQVKYEAETGRDGTFYLNQLDYLTDAKGNLAVHEIGRFENYAEDVARIFEAVDIKIYEITHENGTAKDDYRTYYDTALAEKVATLCAKDIQHFGYTFDA